MAFFVFAGLLARPAHAARPADEPLSAGPPGQVVDLPEGRGPAEIFSFDESFGPALLALAPEEGQDIADFPTAPGVRRNVRLVRHEIYAEGARILRVDGQVRTEVPRSRLVFFWGSDLDGAGNRLFVAFDPATRAFSGLVHGPEGTHEIERDPAERGKRLVLAQPRVPQGAEWKCGQEDSVETAVSWEPSARTPAGYVARRANALSSLHTGIVAIDTDNEYMAYWSNNTTNATNYIATLLASVNVMYERDLKLRLLQGTTFLRVSADPYVKVGGPNACVDELSEFTDYWNLHYPKASYPRSLAAMLSGKQSSPYSASGIAWIAGSICGGSYDYSFSQLFKTSYLAGDTLILGHEMGHNLGSPHTHCYADPAPDHCYAGEACYTGGTSCPSPQTINGMPNVTGTIMGYCHVSGISGCSTSNVFHPSTISRYVGPTLDAGASSGCLAVVGGGGPPLTVASINPPSGAAAGGTSVAITGTNFVSGAMVSIGGVSATGVSVDSSTSITATTGAHAAGAANVVVTNPDFQTGTLTAGFTYTSSPVVSSIAPASGPTAGKTCVTISGTSFASGATVSIGGVAATSVVVVNATTITAVTGTRAAGTVSVAVTNPDTTNGTLLSGFTYVGPPWVTRFYAVTPCRVLDTRNTDGPLGGPALDGSGAQRLFTIAGTCGIPASARSVSANLTVTQQTAAGSLTFFPGDQSPTGASFVSFRPGITRANNAVLYLATDGTGSVGVENDSVGTVQFILDVNGYFQ